MNIDLSELAKQPESVIALMEGELLFQFEEDNVEVDSSSLKKEVNLTEGNHQQSEQVEKPNLVEELDELVEPTPVQLLLLVFLKNGETVPEEQRVFLRKMIKATEIPGSQMKYLEVNRDANILTIKKAWLPKKWMIFGIGNDSFSKPQNDEIWGHGLVCPPMDQIWNDIPQKQVLWKCMQEYFNLSKK